LRVIQQAGDIKEDSGKIQEEQHPQTTIQINTENITVKNPDLEEASKKSERFLKNLYAKEQKEEESE
jgi:hypothetical protein